MFTKQTVFISRPASSVTGTSKTTITAYIYIYTHIEENETQRVERERDRNNCVCVSMITNACLLCPVEQTKKTMHARDNVLNNEASATHNSTPKSGELGRPNPISNLRLKRMHVCCVPWRTNKRAMHAHDNVLNSEANATHNSSTTKKR